MCEKTEGPEAVDAGTVMLVGTDSHEIATKVGSLLADEQLYSNMTEPINPYGDGSATDRIINALVDRFGESFESILHLSFPSLASMLRSYATDFLTFQR